MVLNKEILGTQMPDRQKREEIRKLKTAPVGTVIYTIGNCEDEDSIFKIIKASRIKFRLRIMKNLHVALIKSS